MSRPTNQLPLLSAEELEELSQRGQQKVKAKSEQIKA
jgi:hypothetical protein